MKRFIFILIILSVLISGCSLNDTPTPTDAEQILKVHFIDVGQADSILINTESATMLIDGGNNADANKVVKYISSQGIKRLDYIIGTHPDEDHIGGLDACVDTFEVGKIIMPKVQKNTKTFESLLKAIKNKNLKVTTAKAGMQFELGSKIKCEIFSPNSDKYDETNDYSAVIKLTYDKTSFLFEGDAGTLPEKEMLEKGFDLRADVLKVGHHGSKYSTSERFLKAVAPTYAVISVGKNNSYKHPHKEILNKLKRMKIEIYRTDRDGTIIMTSDGENISVEKEK